MINPVTQLQILIRRNILQFGFRAKNTGQEYHKIISSPCNGTYNLAATILDECLKVEKLCVQR